MAYSNPRRPAAPAPLWSWWLRQKGAGGLSAELATTLRAAAEALLSPHLDPREVEAAAEAAELRLGQLPSAERAEICGHLARLQNLGRRLFGGGRHFRSLPRDQRRKWLQSCETSAWPVRRRGQAQLRQLLLMAFMQADGAWPSEVADAPPAVLRSQVA